MLTQWLTSISCLTNISLNFQTVLKTLDGKKQLHIIGVEQYMNVIENLRYSVEKPDETQWSKMTLLRDT
jgi:hypothetical protein